MVETSVNNNQQILDVSPLSKWKRFLTYLADLFLNFIIAFLFFNIVIFPVVKSATGYATLKQSYDAAFVNRSNLFYKNELVFKHSNVDDADLTTNIDKTFDEFLSFYVCEPTTLLPADSPYGVINKNEVIFHYFNDILDDADSFKTLFKNYDKVAYFIEDNSAYSGFTLKSEYKTALISYFTDGDLSNDAKVYYKQIKADIYVPMYYEVMVSIEENDLSFVSIDMSYLDCISEIDNFEQYFEIVTTICALASYLFAALLYYFFIPVLTENKKTLAQMFIRNHRIDFNSLRPIKTKQYCFSALFNILLNLCLVMFIPSLLIPFPVLFKFSILFYIGLISLAFNIVSLFFIIFNEYNRSWCDCLNAIVYVDNDTLDKIYAARGYK